jgi:hypothetical protein
MNANKPRSLKLAESKLPSTTTFLVDVGIRAIALQTQPDDDENLVGHLVALTEAAQNMVRAVGLTIDTDDRKGRTLLPKEAVAALGGAELVAGLAAIFAKRLEQINEANGRPL